MKQSVDAQLELIPFFARRGPTDALSISDASLLSTLSPTTEMNNKIQP